ncbi:MAG: hypothetical protein U0Z53_15405 [Blastocatellia bacterium]
MSLSCRPGAVLLPLSAIDALISYPADDDSSHPVKSAFTQELSAQGEEAMITGKASWLLTAVSGIITILALTTPDLFPARTPAAQPQDWNMLDRRVSTIEQRIYSLESRLNQLEQQTRFNSRPTTPAPAEPVGELNLLRSEMVVLASRIKLLECGVVQLDERTLPERTREARRKSGLQSSDSCRLNPEMPIQFPAWK